MQIKLFTIGYTKSSAEHFFDRLSVAGVRCLIDIRASNRSQLSGFAKMPDLAFFLSSVAGIAYRHEPLLVPPIEMMRAYRDGSLSWDDYRSGYVALLQERDAASNLEAGSFDCGCLLCSEAQATHCHRGIAADYLKSAWQQRVELKHL